MYGIEAITASNGWSMAITGAIIVMIGLTVLSFIISQLHWIVDAMDGLKNRKKKKSTPVQTSVSEPQFVRSVLSDPGETMKRFRPLTKELGNLFELSSLIQLFIQHDDPHPHLTIRTLRENGYLLPDGGGLFTWKQPQDGHKG